MHHTDKKQCIEDCRNCKLLEEDIIDGYEGQPGQSYQYCRLGKEVTYLNKHMDTIQDKIFAVYRQLNTQIGSELDREHSVPQICKKAGLSVVESKKVVLYLKSAGLLKVKGSGAGTKYTVTQKIDVESNRHVMGAIDYKGPKAVKAKVVQPLTEGAKVPKQYYCGQKVYTLSNNCIVPATIIKMEVIEGTPLDKINNSTIMYTLAITQDNTVDRDVYSFSDSVEGLTSLLIMKYKRQ